MKKNMLDSWFESGMPPETCDASATSAQAPVTPWAEWSQWLWLISCLLYIKRCAETWHDYIVILRTLTASVSGALLNMLLPHTFSLSCVISHHVHLPSCITIGGLTLTHPIILLPLVGFPTPKRKCAHQFQRNRDNLGSYAKTHE